MTNHPDVKRLKHEKEKIKKVIREIRLSNTSNRQLLERNNYVLDTISRQYQNENSKRVVK